MIYILKKYLSEISSWNQLLYALILIFSFLIFRTHFYGLGDKTGFGKLLFSSSIFISIVLVRFQYRSLRSPVVLFIWILLSVILLVLFLWIRNDQALYFKLAIFEPHYANGMKVPILLLIVYLLFTRLTRKHYHRGLVQRTYSSSDLDDYDGINVRPIDDQWFTVSILTIILGHLF